MKWTFLTMHSGNNGQIFKKIIASNGNWKKNEACDKFYWVNQDLFSQRKNKEVKIKLKKTKLWYSSLKYNTHSSDFVQNMSKSFQTTNFKGKAHFLVK